ncbi:MAG: PIG-L family deacetylase [Actinomycetota bacterium]|nr:PIG-L family deacetylase [Actinomycetota bacterium]
MTTTTTTVDRTAAVHRRQSADTGLVRTPGEVSRLGTVLGVWAHPDDEVYLSGGLLAAAAAAGNRVVVVTATRGERGTDDPVRWPPALLAAVRSDEIVASMAVLDGGRDLIEHRFLGAAHGVCHLDGELTGEPSGATIDELAAIVDEVSPDTVLTFGPDGMTGHSDHRAVSTWTDRALAATGLPTRLLHATVTEHWARRFGAVVTRMDDASDVFAPSRADVLAVDLALAGRELHIKLAALRAQASQTATAERAWGTEIYRAVVAGEWFRPAPSGGRS